MRTKKYIRREGTPGNYTYFYQEKKEKVKDSGFDVSDNWDNIPEELQFKNKKTGKWDVFTGITNFSITNGPHVKGYVVQGTAKDGSRVDIKEFEADEEKEAEKYKNKLEEKLGEAKKLLTERFEKAEGEEVAVATVGTSGKQKGHVSYTKTVHGKQVSIPQKGSVIKEREPVKKEKKEDVTEKPEDVLHGEEHQQFTKLLDSYFYTHEEMKGMQALIEQHSKELEHYMGEIRPMLTKFKNLETAEAKFRTIFKEGDWDYNFLSFSWESKPYKDLYTKAFNMLNDMQKTELKTAEDALKKITSQEKFERKKIEKALKIRELVKSYVGRPLTDLVISEFRNDLFNLLLKAAKEDRIYEKDKEEKSGENIRGKKEKLEKKSVRNEKSKQVEKKEKPEKEETEGTSTYKEGAKRQLLTSLQNLVGLRERGVKLLGEFFSRKEGEKAPKEKKKSLIETAGEIIGQRILDVLEKSGPHKYIKRLGSKGQYTYIYEEPSDRPASGSNLIHDVIDSKGEPKQLEISMTDSGLYSAQIRDKETGLIDRGTLQNTREEIEGWLKEHGVKKPEKEKVLLTNPDDPKALEDIKLGIKAPFVNAQYSTLGGKERASIMLTVSLDDKKDWPNGILENSRYSHFQINNGVIEQFSRRFGVEKFRKTKVGDIGQVIEKINQYIGAKGGHSKETNQAVLDITNWARESVVESRRNRGKDLKFNDEVTVLVGEHKGEKGKVVEKDTELRKVSVRVGEGRIITIPFDEVELVKALESDEELKILTQRVNKKSGEEEWCLDFWRGLDKAKGGFRMARGGMGEEEKAQHKKEQKETGETTVKQERMSGYAKRRREEMSPIR